MKARVLGLAGSLLALAPCAAFAAPEKPLRVFVTAAQVEARKDVDDATKKALKAKRDEARDARKDAEKRLKAELGKKRESWPPDRDEELYRLEEAEALAEADYEYRKIDPKGIADSVQDLKESIQGKGVAGRKERIILVESAADADLLVEVQARRSGKTLPTQIKPDRCFVLFTVGVGDKGSAKSFGRVPANYRPRKFGLWAWRIASPNPAKPVFTFESYNGGGEEFGCQGQAANAASAAIDKFIEDNYPILMLR
jgi:hypothetical protein